MKDIKSIIKRWPPPIAILLLAATASAQAPRVAPLEDAHGPYCTAFSMNEDGGNWITARHCLIDEPMFIAGQPVQILAIPRQGFDIAVLSGPTSDGKFLIGTTPSVGDEVSYEGYEESNNGILIGRHLHGLGRFPITDAVQTWAGTGTSGAPILDVRGGVIGVMSSGWPTSLIALTVPYEIFARMAIVAELDLSP